jgi:hypothetical protein
MRHSFNSLLRWMLLLSLQIYLWFSLILLVGMSCYLLLRMHLQHLTPLLLKLRLRLLMQWLPRLLYH